MTTLRDDAAPGSGDLSLLDLLAACSTPLFNQPVSLRPPPDKSITVVQPHSDDAALSMFGALARMEAAPLIFTVFSESSASDIRRAEDAAFARVCGGAVVSLGHAEHASWTGLSDETTREVGQSLGLRLSGMTTPVLAPAAVSHHPDHRVTQVVAQEVGCRIFWEDVAFWGIYASSIDDRVLFTRRGDIDLRVHCLIAVDITSSLHLKAAALRLYGSQSSDVWRPLRYAWTAARELRVPFEYCERFFVHVDAVSLFEGLFRGRLKEARPFHYGDAVVAAAYLS